MDEKSFIKKSSGHFDPTMVWNPQKCRPKSLTQYLCAVPAGWAWHDGVTPLDMVAVYKCGIDCVADSMKPDSGMSVYSQCPDLIPLERKTEKLQCQESGLSTEFYRS